MESVEIREVWNNNFDEEFVLVRDIVDKYPYIILLWILNPLVSVLV